MFFKRMSEAYKMAEKFGGSVRYDAKSRMFQFSFAY